MSPDTNKRTADAIRSFAWYAGKMMGFTVQRKLDFLGQLMLMLYEEGIEVGLANPFHKKPKSDLICKVCDSTVRGINTPGPAWFCDGCNCWKVLEDLKR